MAFLVATLLSTPTQAEFVFHPKKTVIAGQEYVAFPVLESEALLWVLDTRIPQLEDVITKYQKLDEKQIALIKTATTAIEIHESILSDQRMLTSHWKEAAEARVADSPLVPPFLWAIVGAAVGIGTYELLRSKE